jgi:uncharacterized protein (DUF2236 family)
MVLLEAGLLEAPHPIIAYGTLNSQSADDFIPRYHRSADAFYDWFFGDLETALKTARRVFGYHSRIEGELPEDIGGMSRGRHYDANEQNVLIWVWATIIRPLKEYYEILEGPLPPAEVDVYYRECRLFALLFGIDDALLPVDWSGFLAYFDETAASPIMDLSDEFLSRSGILSGDVTGPLATRVLTTCVLAICARRLPAHVRLQYPNLPAGHRHQAMAATILRLAALWRRLPVGIRQSPRFTDACRRVGRVAATGRIADWFSRTLPPPYGRSYRQAGVSPHGNPIAVGRTGGISAELPR